MKKQLLILGALVLSISIIGWVLYQKGKNTVVYNDTTSVQIDYKNAIELNKKVQAEKDSTINALTDSIIVLNAMVKTKNNQLQTLKTKRNEKNNDIAKFSTLDLNKFLSNFYKDSVK
jgi:ribonuclease HI